MLIEQTKNESLLDDAGHIKEANKKLETLQIEVDCVKASKDAMEKTLKQELIETIDRANRMEQCFNEAQDKLENFVSELETDKAKLMESVSDESGKLKEELEAAKNQNKEVQELVVKLESNRAELLKTIEAKNTEISCLAGEIEGTFCYT